MGLSLILTVAWTGISLIGIMKCVTQCAEYYANAILYYLEEIPTMHLPDTGCLRRVI
ncbi:hypothetical protein D3C80_1211430 [compost metagenome]